MPDLAVEYVEISTLKPHPKSPRKGNIQAIKRSIDANGTYRPIIVQTSTRFILAGRHLWMALQEKGETTVPVVFVDVDEATAKRILVADNRIADLGTYDDELLAEILSEIPDLEGTGYTDTDLADLLDSIITPEEFDGREDDAPPLPETPINSPGDLWQLGNHRLLCGDSCDPESFNALLGEELADGMWTDPPYGVSYVGKTKDALSIENDGDEQARQVVEAFLQAAKPHIRPGGAVYISHAETQRSYLESALAGAGYFVRQALVWVKDGFVLGRSDYQLAHEPLLECEVPSKEFEHLLYGFTEGGEGRLGRGGVHWHGGNNAQSVFEVPKPLASGLHPTMKPVDLIRPMLRNSIERGKFVLDCFGGSGSTLVAAHMEGRRAALIELDPYYADVICRRFEELTGVVPVLVRTGEPVSFVEGGGVDGSEEISDTAEEEV